MAGKGINVGNAFVTIMPSARGFGNALRKEISGDVDKVGKDTGERIKKGIDSAKLGRSIEAALAGVRVTALVTAISSVGSAAVTLGGNLLPLTGFLAGAPALLSGAAAGLIAFKTATAGVGKAIGAGLTGETKKYTQALDKLTPAAAAVTKSLVKSFKDAGSGTQEAFFIPMKKSVDDLGKNLSGPVQVGMTSVAASAGGAAAELAKFAASKSGLDLVSGSFSSMTNFIDGAKSGLVPLLKGFSALATALFPQATSAGNALGSAMAKLGGWLTRIAESGKAVGWFDKAKTVFGQLWAVAKNLLTAVLGIFGAATKGGGDMLGTLVSLTAEFTKFVNSAAGQAQLGNTFKLLGDVFRDLLAILPIISGGITGIASILGSLPAPVRGLVTQSLAWLTVLGAVSKPLTGLITTFTSIKSAVSSVPWASIKKGAGDAKAAVQLYGSAALDAGKKTASNLGNALKAAGSRMLEIGKAAAGGARAVVTAAGTIISTYGKMAASAVASAARQVASWVATGAAAVASAAKQVAAWVATKVEAIASSAATVGALIAEGVAWLVETAVAMAGAIATAAAWLISIWPIALIVAAIIAIVALIVIFWDQIVAALTAAWNFIKGIFVAVWTFIVTAVTGYINMVLLIITTILTAIWNFIKLVWNGIKAAFQLALNLIVALVTGNITAVWSIISTILQATWNVIKLIWAGIVAAFTTAWNFIKRIVKAGILAAKLMIQSGVNLIKSIFHWFASLPGTMRGWFLGVVHAVSDKIKDVISYVKSLPTKVKNLFSNAVHLLTSAGGNIVRGLINGLKNKAGEVWSWLKGLMGGMKKKVLSFFGIHSPSRMFRYFGEMLGSGLVVGMDSMRDKALAAADRLSMAATPDINGTIRATGSVQFGQATTTLSDDSIARVAQALADAPKPDISVQVDSREVARATDAGNRKLARRF